MVSKWEEQERLETLSRDAEEFEELSELVGEEKVPAASEASPFRE